MKASFVTQLGEQGPDLVDVSLLVLQDGMHLGLLMIEVLHDLIQGSS